MGDSSAFGSITTVHPRTRTIVRRGVIPIRRMLAIASMALATFGLFGVVQAAPQQQVCVDVYVELNGEVLVDEGTCLPPPA